MPGNENEEFEFRLRAEKEASGGATTPAPGASVAAPKRRGSAMEGLGEAAMQMGSGLVGKVAGDIGGLAATGKEMISPTPGGGDPAGFKQSIQDSLTYQPRTEMGQKASEYNPLAVIGKGVDYLGGKAEGAAAPYIGGPAASGLHETINQGAGFLGVKGAPKVPGAIRGAAEVPGAIGRGVGAAVEGVTGAKATEATRGQAQGSAREALVAGQRDLEGQATQGEHAASTLSDMAMPKPGENLGTIGTEMTNEFKNIMDQHSSARSTQADTLFTEAKAAAEAREAQGVPVDVSSVQIPLAKLIKEAKGIPGLESQLKDLYTSVRIPSEKVAAPTVKEGPRGKITRRAEPAPEAPSKTFSQLELTRRYLNDIAYGPPVEGFSAIGRGAAKEAATALDKSMQAHTPEFATYKNAYREMSKPLEALSTRFGKAMADTQGGLKGDAIGSVSSNDIPTRIFSKPEGVKLMIDAIGQAKTDALFERWITESVRGKSPEASLSHVRAPGMQASLEQVPSVGSRVTSKFESNAKLGETAASGVKAKDAASVIATDLAEADRLSALPGAESHNAAYKKYASALERAGRAGVIPKDKFLAAQKWIDQAATMSEKTSKIKSLMKKIATYAGIGATGVAFGSHML